MNRLVNDEERGKRKKKKIIVGGQGKREWGVLLTEVKEVRRSHNAHRPGIAHVDGSLALAALGSHVVQYVDQLSYQLLLGVDLPLWHLFVLGYRRSHHDHRARRADAELIAVDLSCHTTTVLVVGCVFSLGSKLATRVKILKLSS